jgi:hypothetical protein
MAASQRLAAPTGRFQGYRKQAPVAGISSEAADVRFASAPWDDARADTSERRHRSIFSMKKQRHKHRENQDDTDQNGKR